MAHKLVFIETVDVVETTLALDNFRRACDCGRGAVFFSVARGKVAFRPASSTVASGIFFRSKAQSMPVVVLVEAPAARPRAATTCGVATGSLELGHCAWFVEVCPTT